MRQPLDRVPVLRRRVSGSGVRCDAVVHQSAEQARAAFTEWARHLRLRSVAERCRRGRLRLRAHGQVDGVRVVLTAAAQTCDRRAA
ncbi:MAG TPA: hypothetical protein VHJ17_23265 [Thermomonospora sp.]|nr:hypothetical protein [Thermomonospora sp.]